MGNYSNERILSVLSLSKDRESSLLAIRIIAESEEEKQGGAESGEGKEGEAGDYPEDP